MLNKPKLVDIHAHLNFPDFYTETERDEIIRHALDENIWIINVGSDLKSSKLAIDIANQHEDEGIYACVGLHPTDNTNEIFDVSEYRKLILSPKTVAIGECGLEIHKDELKKTESKQLTQQKNIFEQQIELSIETKKPLMIHCRNAHRETLELLEKYKNKNLKGNVHFFSGTQEDAQKYFALGFTVSFTGVITFTKDYDEVIKNIPMDKIMIETDAPFVTPSPYRGKKNEPRYIQEIVKKIAEIKKESYEKIAEITTENAMKLFDLS